MKCLKCGKILVTSSGRLGHVLAHQREDLYNALAKLEAREKRATDPTTAMAYAEAIAMIRTAMEPVRFEDVKELNEQAQVEAEKDSYEHGCEAG